MDVTFICPIGATGMTPFAAAVHLGLTTVVVSTGSVLLALGLRAYRRTSSPASRQETANPRPEPGVPSVARG